MVSTRFSVAIRYGLPFAGAVVGFVMAGGLGLGLGMGLMVLAQVIWSKIRDRGAPQAEDQDGQPAAKGDAQAVYEPPPSGRIMGWTIVTLAAFLGLYGIILGLSHDSSAVDKWIGLFQPAADLLATVIPALRRMPLDLLKRGQEEWAPAVQHVLFVGWLFLFVVSLWSAVDVLVVNRRCWGRARSLMNRRAWTIFALLAVVPIAVCVPFLYFGWSSPSARWSFGSQIGLSMLALSFFVVTLAILVLILSCGILLMWPRTSSGALVDEPGSPIMRRAMAGTLVGRILFGKSDRDQAGERIAE